MMQTGAQVAKSNIVDKAKKKLDIMEWKYGLFKWKEIQKISI